MIMHQTQHLIAIAGHDRSTSHQLNQWLLDCSIAHTTESFTSFETVTTSLQNQSFALLLLDIALLETPNQLADLRAIAPTIPILIFGTLSHYPKMLVTLQYGAHGLLCDRYDAELIEVTIRTALEIPTRVWTSDTAPINNMPTISPEAPSTPAFSPNHELNHELNTAGLNRLQAIATTIPGVIYEYRLSTEREQQFLFISGGIEDLYGFSAEAAIADASLLWNRVMPEDVLLLQQSIQQSWETLEPWSCTYRIQQPEAPIQWIYGQAVPTQQSDGSVVWCGVLMDITDRLSTQTALTNVEAQNRALVEGIPDLLIRMNADGIYLDFKNGGGVQLYRPEQTHIGCSVFDALPTAHAEQRMHFVQEALTTQTIQHYQQEIEIRGDRHYEDVRIAPINSDNVLVIVRDITEQYRITSELRRQKVFLYQIIDALDCLVFVRDGDGRFLAANRAAADRLGVSPKDLIGKREIDVGAYNPVTFETYLKVNRHVMRTEQAVVLADECLNHHSGPDDWYQTRIDPFYDEQGTVQGIVGVSVNITKRRNLEQALQHRLNQLATINSVTTTIRQSLDLDTIFQTAVKLLTQTFKSDRAYLFAFNSVEHLFTQESMSYLAEYRASEEILMLDRSVPIHNNPHLRHVLLADNAIASDNVYRDPLLTSQAELCRHINLKSMLAVRTSYQGTANGVVALHQCGEYRTWTTDEKALIEAIAAQIGVAIAHARVLKQTQEQRQELAEKNLALEAAQAATEAANQAKSNFMSRMSHELRTPLNVILGYAQLSLHDPEMPQHHHDGLRAIIASGQHLLGLVHDVLDFSKLEAGAIAFEPQEVSLSDLRLMLQQMFQVQADSKHLRLDFEIDPEVPPIVKTDGNKLRQVLINLLGNALKFTHQGGVGLRISSQDSNAENCTLCIEVMDTGIGIAPAAQTEIFKPFVQAGQSSGGTGLGLAIIREFLNLMQGTIELDSQPGQGSTFRIWLPVSIIRPAKMHSKEVSDRPTHPRILLVTPPTIHPEQHPEQLERLLISIGMETHTIHDPAVAIERCQFCPPHLLIVDAGHVLTDPIWVQTIRQQRHHYPTIVALASPDTTHRASVGQYCDAVVTTPLHEVDVWQLIHTLDPSDRALAAQPASPHSSTSTDFAPLPSHPPTEGQTQNITELSAQQLSTLPAEWLQSIAEYALRCDDKPMRQMVSELPNDHTLLRDELLFRIDNFLFEEVLSLMEAAIHRATPRSTE
jgi:PAS domain S-box-containing protein